MLKRHDIKEGMVLLSSLHTTMALFVNEWQSALLHDVKAMLDKVVSPLESWRHNDPQFSDCDRKNAHAHLQASLLGHARPVLGEQGQARARAVPGDHRGGARRAPQPRPGAADHRTLMPGGSRP